MGFLRRGGRLDNGMAVVVSDSIGSDLRFQHPKSREERKT
jgi:hypothetical protein